MKKTKLLLLFLLFATVTCSFQGDYLPVKSQFYTIEKNSIIFSNPDFDIKVSGSCSRPDLHILSSQFNISIQTKSDSLQVNLRDINFVADNSKFFNRYTFRGPDGQSKSRYRLLPNSAYNFSVSGILTDTLLVEFNDNLQTVDLLMNGISNSDNLFNIPVFLFKTDTTVFHIKK